MSAAVPLQNTAVKPQQSRFLRHGGLLLQRQCACGSLTSSLTGECEACKSQTVLQAKLTIGSSNDPLEQEADRVADQVLAAPINSTGGGALPRIQRFSIQSNGPADTAPPSVDRVLTNSGRPLEPPLRQDMEQRFGYDFSRVRVHFGGAAEQSARDVNANAYTVGHNIVFGAGRFAPETNAGRRLIAHELTHVVQQSDSDGIRVEQSNGEGGLFASSQAAQATATGRQQVTVNGTTSAHLARKPMTTPVDGVAAAQARTRGIQRVFRADLSLDEVMGIIESIRPSESASGMYVLVRNGEVLTLTQDEFNKIRASAQKTLLDGLRKVRRKTEDAQLQYDAQHKIDEDQWIVSGAVRLFGGINDPGESIRQDIRFATANANAAQVFIERGQLVRGAQFFAKSEVFATTAKKSSQAYVDNVISTAETTVTVLEVTAVAAAATVVVIAAILAAPAVIAAAQAAPLVVALGTGAVSTAPVVAVEAVAITAPAAAAVAVPATAAVAVPATAAVAVPAVAAVAAPATAAVAVPAVAAVAVPTTAAASTLSTAALATAGVAVASTTLSSDSPKPVDAEKEKKEEKKTCATQFPTAINCSNISWFKFRSPEAALAALKITEGKKNLRIEKPSTSDSGPCEGVGMHYGVKAGGEYIATISCCPCCTDTPAGPRMVTRCRII